MADQKVSDLPALNGADVDPADLLYIIDSSAGSAGSKKITVGQYQLAPVSGGTANGVMYLNASKVVTTGTGLVFDGTNLGIGTSSPGVRLDVNGGSIRTTSWVDITPSTATNNALYRSTNTGGTFYSGLDNSVGGVTGTGYAGVIWHTGAYPIAFGTSNALRMTLDASGNLSVQDGKQYLWGAGRTAIQGTSASDTMQFFTASLERARITSGGDLLVGTTTSGGVGVTIYNQANNSNIGRIDFNKSYSGIATVQGFYYNNTGIGTISCSDTATSYNTTSDRRLKQNITPAPSASDVIDAIEIVSHDWKSAPDEHVTYGVIAQDLALVAPQAVLQGDDGDEIEKTWGVDYSKLVPMLIKEIQTLRARVAALEGV